MTKDFNKHIGEKIILLRTASGLTQRGFAKKLGVSQQVLSGYENGKNSMTLKTFVEICEKTDAPLSFFLPTVKQYGEVLKLEEVELLNELRKFANISTMLEFVRSCNIKQSNVKSRRCLPQQNV